MFYFYTGTKLLKRNILRQVVIIAYLSNYILNKLPQLTRSKIWKEVSYLQSYTVYIRFLKTYFYFRFLIALVFSFSSISTISLTNAILFLICNRWHGNPEWIFRSHKPQKDLLSLVYTVNNVCLLFLIWEVVRQVNALICQPLGSCNFYTKMNEFLFDYYSVIH